MPLTQQQLAELYERVKADPGAVTGALPPREDAMVSTLIFVVKKAFKERDDKIKALEQQLTVLTAREQSAHHRLEQLEAKSLRFRGDWSPGTTYSRGDLTTHHGSCWFCEIDASGLEPTTSGLGASAWRIFVSRGRTGRSGDTS